MPKYLNLWSSVTIFSVPVASLIYLLQRVPVICRFIVPFGVLAYIGPNIFLGFYQLSRLQHCFSPDRIPKGYGYSKSIFHFLYICGGAFVLFALFFVPVFQQTVSVHNLGCIRDTKNEAAIWSSMGAVLFVFWDLTIVGLYIYKLCRLKNGIIEKNQKTSQTLKRINIELNKILYLTIFLEIFSILIAYTNIYLKVSTWGIGTSCNFILLSIVTYLMLDHNEKDYAMVAKLMNRCAYGMNWKQICCKRCETNTPASTDTTQTVELEVENATKSTTTISLKPIAALTLTTLNSGCNKIETECTCCNQETDESIRTTTSELERNAERNR
eukprot:298192_1